MRQKVLLIAAAVFGVIAFYLNYKTLQDERNKLRARTEEVVLIQMKRAVPVGMEVGIDDVVPKKVERFRNHRGDEILWKNRFDAIKQKADRTLNVGEILKYSALSDTLSKKDGLAGIIKPGHRAISISVDATSSVTALIKPDDNVDILGTFRFPEMKGDQSLDMITMTVLQKVRVLATGKTLAKASRYSRGVSKTKGYSTITLELTPKEVEMIVFAAQKGKLSLSLRSYQDTGFTDDLPSINFRYLEENLDKFHRERKNRERR